MENIRYFHLKTRDFEYDFHCSILDYNKNADLCGDIKDCDKCKYRIREGDGLKFTEYEGGPILAVPIKVYFHNDNLVSKIKYFKKNFIELIEELENENK